MPLNFGGNFQRPLIAHTLIAHTLMTDTVANAKAANAKFSIVFAERVELGDDSD